MRLECANRGQIIYLIISGWGILEKFFELYKGNPDLTKFEVRVHFDGERGLDGGGLIKEAFALFWEVFKREFPEGHEDPC